MQITTRPSIGSRSSLEPVANTVLLQQEFALFEELSQAISGWELDFCQLGRSTMPFYLEQVKGQTILLTHAYLPPSFYQLGCAMPGHRTVSFLAHDSQCISSHWCGEPVTQNSLLVMPLGGEFESISSPGFKSIHISLPIPLLEDVALQRFQLSLQQIMGNERLFCPKGGTYLVRLRQLIHQILSESGISTGGERLTLTPALEQEIASLVLACLQLQQPDQPRVRRDKEKRMHTLFNALHIISSGAPNSIDVIQLSEDTGVSRRTLEAAFRDCLGVSPAFYIKALKLHSVCRALLRADKAYTQVADIARAHGFQHLGQFAADYRNTFGELPSATLRRTGENPSRNRWQE